MNLARPSSALRRRMTAAAVTAAVTLAVAASGLASGAAGAEALAASPSVPVSSQAPVSVPVSVPADLAFEIDVVPLTVTPDPRPVAATGPSGAGSPGAVGGSVRDVAEATLAGLPASSGVTLLLDHPQLGGHLGGVFMGSPGYLLLNASRLAGDPDRTRDVVRHEVAHIYQARLASTRGLAAVDARMVELFGPGGLERSADCVALALGASWTHYTTDCAGPERAAAVDALLAGRMP